MSLRIRRWPNYVHEIFQNRGFLLCESDIVESHRQNVDTRFLVVRKSQAPTPRGLNATLQALARMHVMIVEARRTFTGSRENAIIIASLGKHARLVISIVTAIEVRLAGLANAFLRV